MKKFRLLAAPSAAALILTLALISNAGAQGPAGGGGGGRMGGFGGGGFLGRIANGLLTFDPSKDGKLAMLQRPDVVAELQLTAKQQADIQAEMQSQIQKQRDAIRAGMPDRQTLMSMPAEDRRAQFGQMRQRLQDAVRAGSDAVVAKLPTILTASQLKRLEQLDLQYRGPLAISEDAIGRRLEITPEQDRLIANALGEYQNVQQGIVSSAMTANTPGGAGGPGGGGGFGGPGGGPQVDRAALMARADQIQAEVEKYKKIQGEKALGYLTPAQKGAWKKMLGKPFAFKAGAQPVRPAVRPQSTQ